MNWHFFCLKISYKFLSENNKIRYTKSGGGLMSYNEDRKKTEKDTITNTTQSQNFSETEWFYNVDRNPDDFSETEKKARGNNQNQV
jgi:hypothetical protein